MNIAKNISGLFGGIIFGAGLVVAGMTDPQKVLAFLTLNQHWDPALVFVLGCCSDGNHWLLVSWQSC